MRGLIREGAVSATHDVSDGGLLVAVAEMALAGDIGVNLDPYEGDLPHHAALFAEDQARYLVATDQADEIAQRAEQAGIPCREIGTVGGDAITLPDEDPVPLDRIRGLHEGWLPSYMSSQ